MSATLPDHWHREADAHLDALTDEAITIIREVATECENPVLLFSGGKDSAVLLHLAVLAFSPARLPFPVMHVDTGHNFDEVIDYRDRLVAEWGVRLVVASVQESIDSGRVVEDVGPRGSRNRLQSVTLLDAIAVHGFDAAFGGGRRDEDKARAKERILSFRDRQGRWDPRQQRPEPWALLNPRIRKGEHLRAFPLSNWTELDIWTYIQAEGIAVVPLYFAAMRPTVSRDGQLIVVDDDRMRFQPGEKPQNRLVRFRSLGCYPLSAAVESPAASIEEIVAEMRVTRVSERAGRLIDQEQGSSMERKKREGYF